MEGRGMSDKWTTRFIALAAHVARWSKDPRSKVGAVIVDPAQRIVSLGYNGFPRGIEDSDDRLEDKEVKLRLIVHAEANAILNAIHLPSVGGSTIYCTQVPCFECSKLIIQTCVHRVVCLDTDAAKWEGALHMLAEAEIEVELVGAPRL